MMLLHSSTRGMGPTLRRRKELDVECVGVGKGAMGRMKGVPRWIRNIHRGSGMHQQSRISLSFYHMYLFDLILVLAEWKKYAIKDLHILTSSIHKWLVFCNQRRLPYWYSGIVTIAKNPSENCASNFHFRWLRLCRNSQIRKIQGNQRLCSVSKECQSYQFVR